MTEEQDTSDQSADESKTSKRSRLKDALSRTKTKINKKRQEYRDRTESDATDNSKPVFKLSSDVDDFLSGGRTSTSSPPSSLLYDTSPRPSTSDSNGHYPKPPQQSPRRIEVPRIDISSSQRFPNAKNVAENGQTTTSSNNSSGLLQPEYKSRSQSFTSISSERKARIRGLSVGFIDSPPVVIGEGGDEAETPPVEISRAKARARSASPTGRRAHYTSPKGTRLPAVMQAGRSPDHNEMPPSAFPSRFRSGSLEQQSPVTSRPDQTPLKERNDASFRPGPPLRTGTGLVGMNKEFEMTLGFNSNSPSGSIPSLSNDAAIAQPKPQRPAPSYGLIEHGKPAGDASIRISPTHTTVLPYKPQQPFPPPPGPPLKKNPSPTQVIQPYKPFSAAQPPQPQQPPNAPPPQYQYPPPPQAPPPISQPGVQQSAAPVPRGSADQRRPPPPPPPQHKPPVRIVHPEQPDLATVPTKQIEHIIVAPIKTDLPPKNSISNSRPTPHKEQPDSDPFGDAFDDFSPASTNTTPASAVAPRLPPLRHKRGDVKDVTPTHSTIPTPTVALADRVPLMSDLETGPNSGSPYTPPSATGSAGRFYSSMNQNHREGWI